jgi:lysophospholipase L1-like esterase
MGNNRSLLYIIGGFVLIAIMTSSGRAANSRHLSHGGTILLLGDSIFDLHTGDKRVEAVMKRMLERKAFGARWTIYNEAHGGEYIGPREGTPEGVSEPLFTSKSSGRYFRIVHQHPKADAVIVNYGANDSKVYPPATFRRRLEALGRQTEKDYPGAILIFSTTMYVDPRHSAPYRRDNPMAPGFKNGKSRNKYLEPYNQEIRQFTAEHGYGLVDTFRRIKAETEKGNWDLRLRADDGNPKDDPKHIGDMKWFDNIHPNDKGTEVIARGLVEALVGLAGGGPRNIQ